MRSRQTNFIKKLKRISTTYLRSVEPTKQFRGGTESADTAEVPPKAEFPTFGAFEAI